MLFVKLINDLVNFYVLDNSVLRSSGRLNFPVISLYYKTDSF